MAMESHQDEVPSSLKLILTMRASLSFFSPTLDGFISSYSSSIAKIGS
jgi:hypothetical protein